MSATMFVKHKVTDFRVWKPFYDELGGIRKQYGVAAASVHRDAEDPNTLIVVHQFNSPEAARKFANSPELKSAMAKAGVTGPPEFWFSEDIEHTQF